MLPSGKQQMMENHHATNGKAHYFKCAIFNSCVKLTNDHNKNRLKSSNIYGRLSLHFCPIATWSSF